MIWTQPGRHIWSTRSSLNATTASSPCRCNARMRERGGGPPRSTTDIAARSIAAPPSSYAAPAAAVPAPLQRRRPRMMRRRQQRRRPRMQRRRQQRPLHCSAAAGAATGGHRRCHQGTADAISDATSRGAANAGRCCKSSSARHVRVGNMGARFAGALTCKMSWWCCKDSPGALTAGYSELEQQGVACSRNLVCSREIWYWRGEDGGDRS